jgi:hypothetical protein
MTTSGTYNAVQDTEAIDLITESFERCGKEPSTISPQMLISARRSLQLMFSSWVNNGPNLWELYQYPITLLDDGTQSYDLPADTIYVVNAFTRQDFNGQQTDLICDGISRAEYLALPYKEQTSQRPTQFYLQRTRAPVIYPWPLLQEGSTCALHLTIMRMIQDVGNFSNTLDAPQRAFDAMAADLAHRLSTKYAPDRTDGLKKQRDEAYGLMIGEDRERVPLRIVPNASFWDPLR